MIAAAELTNEQKVAVVLTSLDEEIAAAVLQQLEPEVAARITANIRDLGVVSGSVREQVLHDCMLGIVEMRNAVRGGAKTATALLTRAIGEKRAAALLSEGGAGEHDPFAMLANASPETIASTLGREQPGVIGTVLRYLPPDAAAEVLSLLPSVVRKQTAVFMCRANPPPENVIRQIEEFMAGKLDRDPGKPRRSADRGDRIAIMAGILQHVDRSVEEELLEAIDGFSGGIGSEIKDRLFTFEDIVRLSDPDVRQILQEIDMGDLAISLRGCSIDVREKILNNMSRRAAEGLKEEMEFTPKMKRSDVETRQKDIVNVIRQLDAEGKISLGAKGADEYV